MRRRVDPAAQPATGKQAPAGAPASPGKPAASDGVIDPAANGGAGKLVERARQTSRRLMHIANVIEYRAALTPSRGGGVAAQTLKAAGRRMRGASALRLSLWLCVALPTFLSAIYFGLIASDQFVSEIRLSIRNMEQKSSDNLSSLLGGSMHIGGASSDLYLVNNFINSTELVERLNKDLNLKKLYSAPSIDFFSRLASDASIDDLVEYWKTKVSAGVDAPAHVLTVEVRAFSPDDAVAVTTAIIARSEALVNSMAARTYQDAVRFANEELKRAEDRVSDLRVSLNQYRDKVGLLNPVQAADVTLQAIARLQDERYRIDQELATRTGMLKSNSPVLVELRTRAATIDEQIANLQNQITARKSRTQDPSLSAVMAKFEELQTETQFAQKSYEMALANAEKARADAGRQHFFVVPFVQPTRPETAKYPRRVVNILLTFLASFALWGIGALAVASVRDHAI